MNKGEYYTGLTKIRGDSEGLQAVIERTVYNLLNNSTNTEKPGMLLGKIQSGKTRAFIGIIALTFDNGYDMAIILTKGTKALARQTYGRLKRDFNAYVEEDKIKVCDIMHLPNNFTQFELQQKLVIVVKKETNNLRRVIHALEETYPDLRQKRLLIIDDEADYASIGFRVNRENKDVQINKIASQIDELRRKVALYNYLQVTATPYSLYLQPDNLHIEEEVFKPIRPAFTELLPIYEGYVGGEYYFEESQNEDSPAFYLYEEVSIEELEALKKEDRRSFRIEDVLVSSKAKLLRKAIMNFLVGACIRRIQQNKKAEREKKYSFIIHTEHSRASHSWQERVIIKFKELLRRCIDENRKIIDDLIGESYSDLSHSMSLIGDVDMPTYQEVASAMYDVILKDYLMITKVNSESDEEQLLDENDQLYLRTPMNIFIGGQILDRGLTIDNLIGFYYGRRPQRMQQDTVLQHSRMYGNRLKEDLAITRFYTARRIYEVMKKIHEFDNALREAFEKGAQDKGVVFIRRDADGAIVPCSPNKLVLSSITTLKPYKRLLPFGFQTDLKTKTQPVIKQIDEFIGQFTEGNSKQPFLIKVSDAEFIVDKIVTTLKYEEGFEWDTNAFKASLEYLSKNTNNSSLKGKVWCLVRIGRNLSRYKRDGSFSDAPDTPQDEGSIAKGLAIDLPVLILIQQNGKEEFGWKGFPFWWPILIAPKNIRTVIFSSELLDVSPDSYS